MKPTKTSRSIYELTQGYYSAQAILSDMCRDFIEKANKKTGVVKRIKVRPDLICHEHLTNTTMPNLYCLPGTRRPMGDTQYVGHEWDAANCFVALRRALGDRLTRWSKPELDPDWSTDIAKQFEVRPDRVFEIEGVDQVFMLEVDRGSEESVWKKPWRKFEGYMAMSRALKGQRFTVLWTCQAYRYDKADQDRVADLLPLVEKARAGRMFMMTTQSDFWDDPTGAIFQTDREKGISLLSL